MSRRSTKGPLIVNSNKHKYKCVIFDIVNLTARPHVLYAMSYMNRLINYY